MVEADKDGKITKVEDMKRPPTMREIMSHTAGFGYGLGDAHPVDKLYREKKVLGSTGLHQMIERTAEIPLMFQPGTSWSYSSAVDIQGYIVEKLSGKPFGQFMQENVFEPAEDERHRLLHRPGQGQAAWPPSMSAKWSTRSRPARSSRPTTCSATTMPDYSKPPAMESGGGGLVSTTMDYARFCQMILNKGELDGVRILSPVLGRADGHQRHPAQRAGAQQRHHASRSSTRRSASASTSWWSRTPARPASNEGNKTMSWGGAAGTWFWIDPTNDLIFVGMIQRMGGTGGDDLGTMARTLTYQALLHPEK